MEGNENKIMEQERLDYIPHDVITLPSGGKYGTSYGESLRVAYLDSEDENILFTPNLIQSGKQIDMILRRKILDKFNPDDLLAGDYMAILVFLRTTGLSNEYTFETYDPTTEKNEKFTYILDDINYRKNIAEPNDDGLVSFQLDNETTVKYRYLTIKEQNDLVEQDERRMKSMGANAVSQLITLRLNAQIQDVNGITDKSQISQFIKGLSLKKNRELRRFIADNEPGIETTVELVSPQTKRPFQGEIEFGVDFFYAD